MAEQGIGNRTDGLVRPAKLNATTSDNNIRTDRHIRYADVYVDDFIGLLQGNAADRRRAMRIMLHTTC